jgi:uncharacterized small protein (DUF1192 family)
MTKRTLILLAFILPYMVSFQACNQKQSEHTENQQKIVTVTDGEPSAPNINNLNKDMTSGRETPPKSDEKTSGEFKQVNYNQPNQDFNTQDKRMIIRSGTMSMEVEKYDDTEGRVKQIVATFGGYITNSSATLNAGGKKQGTITIRVASDKFDALVGELSKAGKVVNQNILGNDVTEEYMDSDARVKTQRELESRLLKLLAEKTASLSSIVEVEQKLAAVRENIERTEGRMRYLKDQASYSTIAVSVYEPTLLQTSTGGGFFYELGDGVKRGLKGFTSILSGIITVIIALSPILVILGLAIYIIMRYIKKRKLAKV